MNILTYRGLSARVEFDAEDEILVGRIAGINDVVGFHAEDVKGIVAAFHEAVDDYIETCEKVGKEPEKSYSGKLLLRIKPDLHRRLAIRAELEGKSLNQFSEEALTTTFALHDVAKSGESFGLWVGANELNEQVNSHSSMRHWINQMRVYHDLVTRAGMTFDPVPDSIEEMLGKGVPHG